MKKYALLLIIFLGLAFAQPSISIPLTSPIHTDALTFINGEASAIFVVGQVDNALFRVFNFENMEFELTLPNGSHINADSAQTAGWESVVLTREDVGPLIAPVTMLYLVKENPEAGTYTLNVSSSTPPSRPIATQYMASSIGRPVTRNAFIVGEPSDPRLTFSQGEVVPVILAVFEDEAPVQGLTITVEAYTEAGLDFSFQLFDDGSSTDAIANDGLYSGVLPTDEMGVWFLLPRASNDFTLSSSTTITVDEPDIRLSGEVSDTTIDLDGDGLTDGVELSFGTTGERSGDVYFIGAQLQADNGESLLLANRIEGNEPLTIYFPIINSDRGPSQSGIHKALEDLGEISSYEIVEVFLEVRTTIAGEEFDRLLHSISTFGRTADYSDNIERDNTIFGPILEDKGVDTNGNGTFDHLDVTIAIDTLLAGSYTASAELKTSGGRQIETAFAHNIELGIGAQSFVISFDGVLIAATGEAGPYEVINLEIYPNFPTESKTTALKENAGLTKEYSASDFEGGLPGSINKLIEFVQGLDIYEPQVQSDVSVEVRGSPNSTVRLQIASEPLPPKISGVVTVADGAPVGNVTINLDFDSGETYQTLTDSGGLFSFTDFSAEGQFLLKAISSNNLLYGSVTGQTSLDNPQINAVLIVAERGQGIGVINGTVLSHTGEAVANAAVTIIFSETSFTSATSSGTDGSYNFSGLPTDGGFSVTAFDGTTIASGSVILFITSSEPVQIVTINLDPPPTEFATFSNGDFSDGTLDGWLTEGDVQVVKNGDLPIRDPLVSESLQIQSSNYVAVASTTGDNRAIGHMSQSFLVDNCETHLKGKIRFLSDEWPKYYGSIHNDTYIVTLVTPNGIQFLAQGNLNTSSWNDGILGYIGVTPIIEIEKDVSAFAGKDKPLVLNIRVSDVGDTIVDSALAIADFELVEERPSANNPPDFCLNSGGN